MLQRHDLLRPSLQAWDAMLRSRPDLAEAPLLKDWVRLGRPVIVRRRLSGEVMNDVPTAVPLPPSHGKRRIAVGFPPGAALAAAPPVLLRDAKAAAPTDWRRVIASLVAVGEDTGAEPFVFGGLLWEHLTGLAYLTAGSDLDLLWRVPGEAVAEQVVQTLARLDAAGPVRLDGELVLSDGAGVNWREFARARRADGSTVLAKTMDGVEVRPTAGLFRSRVPA